MSRKNHRPYKYKDIKHSVDGKVACGLGGLSVLLIVGELVATIQTRGQAGGAAGFMGVAAFLLSVVGFIFAIVSWKDEETLDLFKRSGTFLNIILILINLLIVILGFVG